MNAAEQLKFIVAFANRDLTAMPDRDWTNLQDDVRRFFPMSDNVTAGCVVFDPSKDPECHKFPKLKFQPLQNELRELLVARLEPRFEDGHEGVAPSPIKLEVTYWYMKMIDDVGAGFLVAYGKIRDLFLQRTINLLLDPQASSTIRQCPECNKFFLRIRRQLYCSRKCVDRVNHRDWLKTINGKKYLRTLKRQRELERKKAKSAATML
jgi:hypothetical protein